MKILKPCIDESVINDAIEKILFYLTLVFNIVEHTSY